jgi:hypothetical protein
MTSPDPVGIFSCPQQWEYKATAAWDQPSFKAAYEAMEDSVNKLGQQGWEMVNFAMSAGGHHGAGKYANDVAYDSWNLLFYWKRPIAP